MALFQRAADGYPVGADNDLRQSYGPIPDTDHFQHHQRYGYEKVDAVIGWAWSNTFNKWWARVRFADGWQGFSSPKPDTWNKLEAFAHAAAQAINEHQANGKGLRPLKDWDDSDVTDSGINFSSLADNGLQTSDTLEEDIDSVVSAIVFGAFHQDGNNCRLKDASAILEVGGYLVAEVRWNTVSTTAICPVTGQEIVPSWGFWPFLGNKPLALDAFDDTTKVAISRMMSSADTQATNSNALIGGYFILKDKTEEVTPSGPYQRCMAPETQNRANVHS